MYRYGHWIAWCIRALLGVGLIVSIRPNKSAAQARGEWSALFSNNGLNGAVYAIVLDETGQVYIGGSFSEAGGVEASNIARWTGSTWEALGEGFNDVVYALALGPTGDLFAGGRFTEADGMPANHIARWTGAAWESLGEGITHSEGLATDVSVEAIGVDVQGKVYVGGSFTKAGEENARGIAMWDGTNWQGMGDVDGFGCVDERLDDVWAMTLDESGTVYIGGKFSEAGGVPVNGVAQWTGEAWQGLGSGFDEGCPNVLSLVVHGGDLYAGGSLNQADNEFVNNIARWTGEAWESLDTGVNGGNELVQALASHPSGLFVGGRFTEAGGRTVNQIAKWTGAAWEPLGEGIAWPGAVLAIGTHENEVYVGGEAISEAGAIPAAGIALWEDATTISSEEPPDEFTQGSTIDAVFPNPFTSQSNVVLSIPPGGASVRLEAYNLIGQQIAVLIDGILTMGFHTVNWDTSQLPPGHYLLRLHMNEDVVSTITITKTS